MTLDKPPTRVRVFIVCPSDCFYGDKRHDVCTHDGRLSAWDAYAQDKFDQQQTFMSLGAARRYARRKFGSKRLKLI